MKVGDRVKVAYPGRCIHSTSNRKAKQKGLISTISKINGSEIYLKDDTTWIWCANSLELLESPDDFYKIIAEGNSYTFQQTLNKEIEKGYKISDKIYHAPNSAYSALLEETIQLKEVT